MGVMEFRPLHTLSGKLAVNASVNATPKPSFCSIRHLIITPLSIKTNRRHPFLGIAPQTMTGDALRSDILTTFYHFARCVAAAERTSSHQNK
jgi:hypothetical protein